MTEKHILILDSPKSMKSRKKTFSISLLFLFILVFAGCRSQQEDTTESPSSDRYHYEKKHDHFTVIMEISDEKISLAQVTVLSIQVSAPEDYTVFFPEYDQSMGDFTITETTPGSKELTDKGLQFAQTWTLSPFLPGDYTIPPLPIRIRHNHDKQPEEVITLPGRTVSVSSLLDPDEQEPQLSDILPPQPVPLPGYYYIAAVLAGTVFLGLIIFFFKKFFPGTSKKDTAAHINALRQIDLLLAQTPPEEDFALFFSRLSLILRHYIEARFLLKAAEQTTEEFLFSLYRSSLFTQEQKEMLENFLTRSDLIKFAMANSGTVEAKQSVELCRTFIHSTALDTAETGGQP